MFRRTMDKMRYGLQRLMQGRYGSDQLNMVILISGIVLEIISSLFGWTPLYIVSLLFLIVAIFRVFSRNISKRYAENQRYLRLLGELKILKTHHIYKCPNCKQKIRVPRKGGKKVEIRCPKCNNTFIKTI